MDLRHFSNWTQVDWEGRYRVLHGQPGRIHEVVGHQVSSSYHSVWSRNFENPRLVIFNVLPLAQKLLEASARLPGGPRRGGDRPWEGRVCQLPLLRANHPQQVHDRNRTGLIHMTHKER